MHQYILTISCPDQIGIVAAVTTFIAQQKGMIVQSHQHGEPTTNTFFMRVVIDADNLEITEAKFNELFQPIAEPFNMEWKFEDTNIKKRVAILASKQNHCLVDLLHRWQSKELDCDIVCVISNHIEAQELALWHDIPFHYVNFTESDNQNAFATVDQILTEATVDVIVLARFMRIMPGQLCKKYFGKMINIHHSFLPAFTGANPYQQAFEKGVKLIGATCHYVTEELDQGPIIEQGIARIHHGHTPNDMKRLGRDVEKIVLANGLRYHLNSQIIIHQNKTVVFE
ncbi:MAG: formyltetrahydrofolate deformylase [Pseudomonadota bacterium]|nr:formyltetrahydrofolate deformylase [Pseudomonadota bacterium]